LSFDTTIEPTYFSTNRVSIYSAIESAFESTECYAHLPAVVLPNYTANSAANIETFMSTVSTTQFTTNFTTDFSAISSTIVFSNNPALRNTNDDSIRTAFEATDIVTNLYSLWATFPPTNPPTYGIPYIATDFATNLSTINMSIRSTFNTAD
jgi:hypothetical protein